MDWLYSEEPVESSSSSALQQACNALSEAGIDLGDTIWWTPGGAILITEAVNWAAKILDPWFYELKPQCIREALELGAEGGWGRDGCFFLFDISVGTASFHDPCGQIDVPGTLRWNHPWSGIPRQNEAFELLVDRLTLRRYQFATNPSFQGKLPWIWQGAIKPINRLP